jgi:ribonuclease Z
MRWESIENLEIYGGKGALGRVRDLLYGVVLRGAQPPMPLTLREIQPGVFFDADDFSVTAFPVWHRGPDCLGYLFEEKARRPFLPEKADELGIPPGPWRRDLVNGRTARLPDGRLIQPDDVLAPVRSGVKFVHIGDVGRTDELVSICRDADALVIESTYLDEEADMARQFAHLTAKAAAELAVRAGVKQLVLTHLSRRYRERDVLAEARAVFPHTVVARDFDMFQVKRGEFTQVEKPEFEA